ncbi:hypothetical protein, partial [Pedobacter ginsenosidimutans]|uniref:hypothetical protein n=1 Tax=Pedobacter ginsenosidimutans TaxID=687842 RepID=UPI000A6BC49C
GNQQGLELNIGDWVISNGNVWERVDNNNKVTSVNGRQGSVMLGKGDIGLGSVDNTSDAAKPVSAAQQAVLDGKANSNGSNASGVWAIGISGNAATVNWSGVIGKPTNLTHFINDLGNYGNWITKPQAEEWFAELTGDVFTGQVEAPSFKINTPDGLLFGNDFFGGGGDQARIYIARVNDELSSENQELRIEIGNDAPLDRISFRALNPAGISNPNGVFVADWVVWNAGNFNPASKSNIEHTHIWANITDRPTNLSDFNNNLGLGSLAYLNNGDVLSSSITGNATTATTSQFAERIGNDSSYMRFHWSGQDGQPNWLWGGNAPGDMYVYNPANFNVAYATLADFSNNWKTYGVSNFDDVTGFKLLESLSSNTLNQPNVNSWGQGIQFSTNNNPLYANQLVYSADGQLWTRSKSGGSFGNWDRILSFGQDATKLQSTTHQGTYWLENNWDGTFWQLHSNHGAGVNVYRADHAADAERWGGWLANFNTDISDTGNPINAIAVRDVGDGKFKLGYAPQVRQFLGLGSAAYLNASGGNDPIQFGEIIKYNSSGFIRTSSKDYAQNDIPSVIYGAKGSDDFIWAFTPESVKGFLGLGSGAFLNANSSSVGNSLAYRDGNGFLFSEYINTTGASSNMDGNGTLQIRGLYGDYNNDGYHRLYSSSAVKAFLGLGAEGFGYFKGWERGFENKNLNNQITQGFYDIYSADNPSEWANVPNGGIYGGIAVFHMTNVTTQLASDSSNRHFIRCGYGGGSNPITAGWRELAFQDSFTGTYQPLENQRLSTNNQANFAGLVVNGGADLILSSNGGNDIGDLVWQDTLGEKHRLWDGDATNQTLTYRYRIGTVHSILHSGNFSVWAQEKENQRLSTNNDVNFERIWANYGANTGNYSWVGAALTTNSIEIVNSSSGVTDSSPTLAFHRCGSGGPQFRLDPTGTNVLYLESANANSARNPFQYGNGANNYFVEFVVDGKLQSKGRFKTYGNTFLGASDAFGSEPTVTLAIGDSDTGLHWTADGNVQWWSNNQALYNMQDVWRTNNFDPNSKANTSQLQLQYIRNYGGAEFWSETNTSTAFSDAALQLRESQHGASTGFLAPRLAFHWGGVAASQITIESDGRIAITNNPGTGYQNFIANNVYGANDVSANYTYGQIFTSGGRIWTGYDSGFAGAVSASNWFRSNGNSGWINETHQGGIYMEDSTWVRVYNGKAFLVNNEVNASRMVVNNDSFKSTSFRGMAGDYDQNGTTDKIIWTIGDNWATIQNMYGIGYQYGTKYGNAHSIVFRINGNVTSAISLENGNGYFDGKLSAGTGSNGGFGNATYTQGHNNIWRLHSDPEYGIAYYQNWGAAGSLDATGFHFGDRNNPVFFVRTDGEVHLGNGKGSSSLVMHDIDEATRVLHTNSNRIGFLTTGGAWGSYCENDGGWRTDAEFRVGSTKINGSGINVSAGNGNGIGFWESGFAGAYSIWMGETTTYGGNLSADGGNDYNMYFRMTDGNRGFVFRTGNGQDTLQITNNKITVNGIVSASGGFYDTSDKRLKTETDQIFDARNIKAHTYFKNDQLETGYFAQEVQTSMPHTVKSDSNGILSLSYTQVLVAKVANLEDDVKRLQEEINFLKQGI